MESITGAKIEESAILLVDSARAIISCEAVSKYEERYNRIVSIAGYVCSAFTAVEPHLDCDARKCNGCKKGNRSESINRLKKTIGELQRLVMAIEIISELEIADA